MTHSLDIVQRLRFDAVRCETTFSKGVAQNIEEGADEIERLRAALGILYADCADYIRVNNLYRGDGKSAIWNQAMKQAADALGVTPEQAEDKT